MKQPARATSIELIKMFGETNTLLRKFYEEKDYPQQIRASTNMVAALLTRNQITYKHQGNIKAKNIAVYKGTPEQNYRIDRAISTNSNSSTEFFGTGAAGQFSLSGVPSVYITNTSSVQIAVVGQGAAGILVTRALRRLGYKVHTYEKRAAALGIWSLEDVYRGSRNNPRDLRFDGHTLFKAPGEGREVREFLNDSRLFAQTDHNLAVTRIKAGQLNHELTFSDGSTRSFPIVINAIGLGRPKDPNDPTRMTTSSTKKGHGHVGLRWQTILDAQEIRRKRLVFVGLGNSTAEMLRQVHRLQSILGVVVDYRVLTHYPSEAIYNPNSTVSERGRHYRVFRDLSIPNLVDYQGDLADSRFDYYKALMNRRIVYGARHWEVDGDTMYVYGQKKGGRSRVLIDKFKFDKVWTLIGYGHTRESVEKYDCVWDDKYGCIRYDFDGEMHSRSVSHRLAKGYFGFGSILESPLNPNAVVIPGMIHRIGDLLFSVIQRAREVRENRR